MCLHNWTTVIQRKLESSGFLLVLTYHASKSGERDDDGNF